MRTTRRRGFTLIEGTIIGLGLVIAIVAALWGMPKQTATAGMGGRTASYQH